MQQRDPHHAHLRRVVKRAMERPPSTPFECYVAALVRSTGGEGSQLVDRVCARVRTTLEEHRRSREETRAVAHTLG